MRILHDPQNRPLTPHPSPRRTRLFFTPRRTAAAAASRLTARGRLIPRPPRAPVGDGPIIRSNGIHRRRPLTTSSSRRAQTREARAGNRRPYKNRRGRGAGPGGRDFHSFPFSATGRGIPAFLLFRNTAQPDFARPARKATSRHLTV